MADLCRVRAERLADRFVAHLGDHEPVEATRLGLTERDAELPDLAAPARAARARSLADLAADVEAALGDLPTSPSVDAREAQGDLLLLRDEVARRRASLDGDPAHATDPLPALDAVATAIHLLLQPVPPDPALGPEGPGVAAVEQRRRVAAAIARARRVPAFLEQAGTLLASASAPHLDVAMERLEGIVALVRDALPRRAGEVGLEVDHARDAGEYAAEGLQAFGALLTELPDEPADGWRLGPDGYAWTLRVELGAGLSPAELEERARAAVARRSDELADLADAAARHRGSGAGRTADPGERVRTALAAVAARAVSAERLLPEATAAVAEARAFVAAVGLVDLPPAQRLTVARVPPHLEGVAVAFLQPSAALDRRRGSTYFLSGVPERWDPRRAAGFLREHHPAMLRWIAVHEAYPGHFVQLEHAALHPRPVRRVVTRPVFAEGWAVHMERAMLAAGFGQDGSSAVPLDDLVITQRLLELRIAVDALVDLGVHAGSMDDREALRLLTTHAHLAPDAARGTLTRVKVSPGRLSTYFAGAEELDELRRGVEAREGAAFDAADLHRRLLSHGTPTVGIVAAALADGAPARRPFAPAVRAAAGQREPAGREGR